MDKRWTENSSRGSTIWLMYSDTCICNHLLIPWISQNVFITACATAKRTNVMFSQVFVTSTLGGGEVVNTKGQPPPSPGQHLPPLLLDNTSLPLFWTTPSPPWTTPPPPWITPSHLPPQLDNTFLPPPKVKGHNTVPPGQQHLPPSDNTSPHGQLLLPPLDNTSLPPVQGQRSQHLPLARVKGHNTPTPATTHRREERILLECIPVFRELAKTRCTLPLGPGTLNLPLEILEAILFLKCLVLLR